MPDFMDYTVTREAPVNVNVPSHKLAGRIVGNQGETLHDFTGSNAQDWPGILSTLTVEQQNQIAADNGLKVLQMKAGLL